MRLTGIDEALRSGCKLHAFRSGGGLRVIRIQRNGVLKGYGEHPNVEDALAHANQDLLAGGRPYKEVYGGTHPHYLTGSTTPTSPLDLWLLQGHFFEVWQEGDEVVFQLEGLKEFEIPADVKEQVWETGEPITWEDRGFTYRTVRSQFPNGELCLSTELIKTPKGVESHRAWGYYITKTGRGKDFWEAMDNAFKASPIEVPGK